MSPAAPSLAPLSPGGPSTCTVGHLHTLLNLAVLLLAQAGDLTGQHTPMGPNELTEQQNVLAQTQKGDAGQLGRLGQASTPGALWLYEPT